MASPRRRLLAELDRLKPDIVGVSAFIHSHPELGFAESLSSDHLSRKLTTLGFSVERPLASIPTALRASFRGRRKGPTVGFIAEYDALPGLGHACGHNLIAASAFGAAAALAACVDTIGGSVVLYGTPAEEAGGAKVPMARAGVFDEADAVLMMHPESVNVVNIALLALDALQFTFHGRTSHAAATPHEGINALDAVIQLFNGINALRQQLKPDIRVHGIITQGGVAPNIIPDLAEARFYVRARRRADRDAVSRKVKACARGAAKATGCRLRISGFEPSCDDALNNPVLSSLLEKNLRSLGVRDILPEDAEPGSSDFGNVTHRVPSQCFYMATAPKGTDLHTAEFARLAAGRTAQERMLLASKVMALTGLDLLRRPALASEVREAFQRAKAGCVR